MARSVTRRDFIRSAAGVAFGAALHPRSQAGSMSRVVLVRHEDVWESASRLNGEIVQRMLDDAVMALVGRKDPVEAFRPLVKPEDVVGIKSNMWRFLPTPRELERAIERRVKDVGVPADRISIDDRGVRANPVFRKATAIINTRPMRTHFWAGVGGCLKNFIPFSANPPDYHPDSCADLALLWKLPMVEGKTRLNVLSLLNPLFHGRGPHHFDRRYVWKYNGLVVGRDPVAVDSVGLQIINAKRLDYFGRKRGLQTSPKHIRQAEEKHHLGVADPSRIDLVKLGWREGILI